MEKQLMLQALGKQEDANRKHRPSTAKMNIAIFRALCSGKSGGRIAMDIPCAESTVYRAIRRVKDYLKPPDVIANLRHPLKMGGFTKGVKLVLRLGNDLWI